MGRILIADRTHEVLEEKLREAGFVVSVEPDHDYESLVAAAQGCVGLVVRSKVIIDSGEHAVGLLLALIDNIARADAEVRQGLWRREANRGIELGSLTVGIIGYGNMGQSFAKRLSGFGCRVVIYDKYKEIGTLEEVQREADVVSFHVPLTDETHHYLDTGFIEAMAKPFFVVNTARGAVVDTEALVQGMERGKVRGAALDVLEYENMQADGLGDVPVSMQYLMRSPLTVLTPHVAGWTVESKYKLAAVLADKMIKTLKG